MDFKSVVLQIDGLEVRRTNRVDIRLKDGLVRPSVQ